MDGVLVVLHGDESELPVSIGFSPADEQVYCGKARDNTDETSKRHESDIVLLADADIENPEHFGISIQNR